MLQRRGWRIIALLIVSVMLVSCGSDVTSTLPVAESVPPAIVPTGNLTQSLTLTTPVATTPKISSGLTKGKLKEVFPILARLPGASLVRINKGSGGLGGASSSDYELRRTATDFTGLGLFQAYYYTGTSSTYEEAREITVPLTDMKRYLELLTETPIEEGPYKGPPLATVSDNFPLFEMEVETENGLLTIGSTSQKPDFFPWTITFAGRTFTAADATPFQAYNILKPYLKEDVLKDIYQRSQTERKPFISTAQPTPAQSLNPLNKVQEWPVADKLGTVGLISSPDGKLVATNHSKKINVWNLDGSLLNTVSIGVYLTNLWAFSPDSKTLFDSLDNSNPYSTSTPKIDIQRWDIASGKELPALVGHRRNVNALAFSGDGKLLVSAGSDRTVRLWSLPDGKNTATLRAKLPELYRYLAVALSPDGKRVVAGGGGDPSTKQFPIKVWTTNNNQEEQTLRGHATAIKWLGFTPGGETLVSADESGLINLWDTTTWQKRLTIDGKTQLLSVSLSPDGKLLASSNAYGGLRLWELATGKLLSVTQNAQSQRYGFRTAIFTADGRYILTPGADSIQKWEVKP